jgi:hypothetical protein
LTLPFDWAADAVKSLKGSGEAISSGGYTEGEPKEPSYDFGNAFPYDPNAEAGWKDHWNWEKWDAIMVGGALASSLGFYGDGALDDAVPLYSHYRSGRGTDQEVNYREAYYDQGQRGERDRSRAGCSGGPQRGSSQGFLRYDWTAPEL